MHLSKFCFCCDLSLQRLREHQQELEKFRFAKDAEVKQERQQFETFKRELQSQLRQALNLFTAGKYFVFGKKFFTSIVLKSLL